MKQISYWAVPAAAAAAFAMSSIYYSPLILGNVWRSVDPAAATARAPSAWIAAVEFVRTLVIAFVLARLIMLLGSKGWRNAAGLALWLWFGYSAMMWAGAVMWEKTPWQVAAIHSGDWLLKTLMMAAILGAWQR